MNSRSTASRHTENFNEISATLKQRLETARQQYPERFSKPIFVLRPVDQRRPNGLVEGLQEAKENARGERIILIPYFVEQQHWIGIILQFSNIEQLQRAEYFNPVIRSTFDAETTREQFTIVYPNSTLLKTFRKEHVDIEFSAKLTIDNLLTAAEEFSSTKNEMESGRDVELESGNDKHDIDASNNSNFHTNNCESVSDICTTTEVPSIIELGDREVLDNFHLSDSTSSQARHKPLDHTGKDRIEDQEYLYLKAHLENRLKENDISDESELEQRLEAKKREIQDLQNSKKLNQAQKRKQSLSLLEEIQAIADKVKALTPKPKQDFEENEDYVHLKADLENRLKENDISDESELEQRIEAKKQEIQELENSKKLNQAQKRKQSLSLLEEIEAIAEKVKALTPKPKQDFEENQEYVHLKADLENRLKENDISDESELEQRIEAKKQEIQQLEKANKQNQAQKRKQSLSLLEEILALGEKVKALTPKLNLDQEPQENQEYLHLKADLENQLKENDISDESELEQRIEAKKQEIQQLEKASKQNQAQKRRGSLSQLEKIRGIAEKVKALTPKSKENPEDDHKYLLLKADLEARLKANDITDKLDLEDRIEAKKQEIQELERSNKQNQAQRRRGSLSQLEEIKGMFQQIQLKLKKDVDNTISNSSIVSDVIRSVPGDVSSGRDNTNPSISEKNSSHISVNEKQKPRLENSKDQKPDVAGKSSLLRGQESNREDDGVIPGILADLAGDLKAYPLCAEKHVLALLLYTSMQLMPEASENISRKIDGHIKALQERLKVEEIEMPWINAAVDTCEIYFKNENWEPALKELKKIWKHLSPINMQELRRLVDKVDDATKLIKDKEIILFMGGTGAGKSTTIHFFGGSTMTKEKVNGMNHIAPTKIINPDLLKIETAPSATSITRYISPVTINLKDIGNRTDSFIILCDSPGFEDTSGPEVDIANGIGIVKAIKGCRSVKPVVLLSFKSMGDRCTGVKDLAHTLVGLMPGIKEHMKSFTYLFTKFTEEEKKTINAVLSDVQEHLKDDEKSDISFTSILEDMIKKTRRGAKAVNPVKDDPLDIIEDLIDSAPIYHPEEVFHFSVSEKSKISVQEQVRGNQVGIIAATKRFDYAYIQFKLDQLKYLYDLIQQDYIRQIYKDSVTFVSKHLIEQYHTATTTFDRCIKNQTILSINDIQQYRTSIAHARDADDLRTKHLTPDVLHSSAYEQYLDQLIRSLYDDLNGRNIDEAAVKVSFDKMKLLTDYFPDVVKVYQDSLKVYIEKIDSSVAHARKSVIENKFDEAANSLKALQGATFSLDGHVSHDKLQTSYETQKQFLLHYLTESTVKFDNIFSRKLEKNDIENLNRCICMIESAEQTFTLHAHISLQKIHQIRENLSIKILNYFNDRLDQINEAIKKTADLSTLEQLMGELDAIRTISGFDIITSQSYFDILGQLIGYINECRRDAERQIHSLFRQESVDFTRLIRSLAGLQSARWIEKYREGVYSDLISNVEQQVRDQLELLNKSIMQTNLDLDRTEKIQDTYRIIEHIDEMKRLTRFFPSINEQINQAHTWFKAVTDDVFDSLLRTFSIEKWKEQGGQTPDFGKAEKGLRYLYTCKEIPLLSQSRCSTTLNSLEDFIRYFSNEINNEINNHFEKIKQYQLPSKDDIYEKARNMANRLCEVSEIEEKYKLAYSYFVNQRIIEEWKKIMAAYHSELQDEMELMSRTGRVEDLNSRLSIAKALSKLDGFSNDHPFIDLYKQYQGVFFSNTDDVCRRAIDAINKNDYDLVASEMAALERSDKIGAHFLKQARRAINFGISTLIEETKNKAIMLGHNIEREEISAIVAHLKKLQKAKQFISSFIDRPEDIDECIEEVKRLTADRMKRFMEGVRASITVNNFSEADKKIDSITLVRNLLGVFCADDVAKDINSLKESQSDIVLKDLVKKYSEMDISKYTLNPPTDIFAKFGEVRNTNPIYNQACNTIRENILTKFRQELDSAKSLEPPSADNIHIRKFESAIKYLPKDMKESLEDELKNCKEDITNSLNDHYQKLNNTLESGDLKAIKSILEDYQKSPGMKTYFNKAREHVLTRTKEIASKIQKSFADHDIFTALESIKIMYDYQVEFEKLITDIKPFYSDVRKHMKKMFEEAYFCFCSRFVEKKVSIASKDAVRIVEESFKEISDFITFSSKYRDLPSLKAVLPDDFHQKVNTLHEKLTRSFIQSEKQYQDALSSLDILSLREILEVADQWHSLIEKMRSYYTEQHIYDDGTNDLLRAIGNLTLFERMIECINDRLEKLRDDLIKQELINSATKGFSKSRDEFYKRLNDNYIAINKANELNKYSMRFDAKKAEAECVKSLEDKMESIYGTASNIFQKFMKNINLTKTELDQFNVAYNNLVSCKKEIKVLRSDITSRVEEFDQQIESKIHLWESTINQGSSIDTKSQILVEMKSASNNFPQFKQRIDQRIDVVLMQMKNSKADTTAFGKLGVLLNQDSTGVGQSIVNEHKAFQGYSLSLFNEKTRKHGIEYVIENLKGDHCDKSKLKKRYDEFHKVYQGLTNQYLKPNLNLEPLIATTKMLAGSVKQEEGKIEWDATIKNKVPELLAHIFALWTLQSAHHFFEAEGTEKKESYLLQPHAAQIISIFRMLGIGDSKEELSNNLVQIGTGEGKSITLGATASLLALLGFDVCCACYSEYLSERDYRSFLPLFTSLDVVSHVHYGTFNQLCEYIINQDGDIRQVVEQLITTDTNQAVENAKQAKRAKILLIDEVDVFFSRDFYGNIYTPSTSLRDPTIRALINYIWSQRKTKLTLKKVKETQEYNNCRARFSKWESLIEESIKDMIADVASFESHNYVPKDDKIGYIEQDNIIFNVVYGYKTLFAYYLEHEREKISGSSLDEKISITIKCGGYSYAETPLQFQYIMGVTGTLETLSVPEKEVIKNVYKINKQTISPSVFGKNNLKFTKKDDIKIETNDDYYNVIKREIDDRLRGSSDRRAVLVFFESEKKLRDFYRSDLMKPMQESVAILTEEASPSEKETIIKKATGSGQVTLFTKSFGRGTDFICYDPSVAANGGIHVIQTFLSEEVSEEVQIKGRTARQGDQGSYSMILLDKELEKFHITPEDIQDMKDGKKVVLRAIFKVTDAIGMTKNCESVYDLLNGRRMDFFATQYEANTQYVHAARKRHESGQRFLTSLKSNQIDVVREFLVEENKGAPEASNSRTICLMDATGSMSHLLQKSKNTVSVMFDRASIVLKDNGISTDCFQIQFVVYRNYCCREDKILQHSPWETKPDNLRAFMNTIDVEGGLGNEAIEIGLQHANEEYMREEITQIILIGDAPPNTKDEVTHRRTGHGENYWKTTKFAQMTYYEDELQKLKPRQIPVHSFYVKNRAKQSFEEIAKCTGGRCEFLDINSPSGSDMLTDLVTEEILRNVGKEKGNALVDAYRARFARSYVSK